MKGGGGNLKKDFRSKLIGASFNVDVCGCHKSRLPWRAWIRIGHMTSEVLALLNES